jgi:hypothetical protein
VRTGVAEVRDQAIVSDGITNDDLKIITSERMAEYTGSTGSYNQLWITTVSKANYELNPPPMDLNELNPISIPETKEEIKLPETDPSKIIELTGNEPKPFCDSCDSKGVRHKKECVNYIPTNGGRTVYVPKINA